MYFHGARSSNYEAWLSDPTHIGPSAQVVWPIVGLRKSLVLIFSHFEISFIGFSFNSRK